jgi:hypothetical protein
MFSTAVTLSIYAVTTSMLRILQNHLLVQANDTLIGRKDSA